MERNKRAAAPSLAPEIVTQTHHHVAPAANV